MFYGWLLYLIHFLKILLNIIFQRFERADFHPRNNELHLIREARSFFREAGERLERRNKVKWITSHILLGSEQYYILISFFLGIQRYTWIKNVSHRLRASHICSFWIFSTYLGFWPSLVSDHLASNPVDLDLYFLVFLFDSNNFEIISLNPIFYFQHPHEILPFMSSAFYLSLRPALFVQCLCC